LSSAKPLQPLQGSRRCLKARGNIRSLFNTSGTDFKALGLNDKLSKISEAEALGLLSKNRNLLKRPFLTGEGVNLARFDEVDWKTALA
jgi:arsenate reductase